MEGLSINGRNDCIMVLALHYKVPPLYSEEETHYILFIGANLNKISINFCFKSGLKIKSYHF